MPGLIKITTQEVTDTVITIATDEDIDTDWIKPPKVGRVLGKFGLSQAPRPGGKGPRAWQMGVTDLERLTNTYGLGDLYTDITGSTGTTGSSGSDDPVPNDSIPNDSVCEVITLKPEGRDECGGGQP